MKFIVELTEKQYEALVKRAAVENGYEADDDFNPYDYSGGNFDDCYRLGLEHADADAAREILSLLTQKIED